MKKLVYLLSSALVLIYYIGSAQPGTNYSPDWVKDLIIYEIAPKGFTSPLGAESGTFKSLKEKIPYLKELGINGVWLTGHHLSAPRFFYHCWNQYAVLRPDSIDKTLGTEDDFKELILEFHKKGIKVFLDVITHGVMNESSLIKQHPDWFRGGSWGMTDYDWEGNHADLDKWWVDMYTRYVTEFGADGYRLDVDINKPELWKKIKENCLKAGHPIAVWLESDNYTDGACDFLQRQANLSIQTLALDTNTMLANNVAKYFDERIHLNKYFQVYVHYTDNSTQYGFTEYEAERTYYGPFQWPLSLKDRKNMLKVTVLYNPDIAPSNEKYEVNDETRYIQLKIENLETDKRIKDIKVTERAYWNINWDLGSMNDNSVRMSGTNQMILYLKPFVPDVKYYSIELSSHDDGWEGFPADANPYVAEGSRCAFGYSCLFAPAIPIFFSGEEFNADYRALPNLSPDLYGKGTQGSGKWLYGSWIQWEQVKMKQHAQMLDDVKKIIKIRKDNSDLIYAWHDNQMPNIIAPEFKSNIKIPTPYILWNDKKIIIVAGNRTDKDADCNIEIPVEKLGIQADKTYKLTDEWNDKIRKVKGRELENFHIKIKRDKVYSGGLAIFKIEKN